MTTYDSRAGKLSDEALLCRQDRRHRTITIVEALRDHSRTEARSLGYISIERECLNGCGVTVVDEYKLTGERVDRFLRYPKAGTEEAEGYLMPKGTGPMHPEDARHELFGRLGFHGKK